MMKNGESPNVKSFAKRVHHVLDKRELTSGGNFTQFVECHQKKRANWPAHLMRRRRDAAGSDSACARCSSLRSSLASPLAGSGTFYFVSVISGRSLRISRPAVAA